MFLENALQANKHADEGAQLLMFGAEAGAFHGVRGTVPERVFSPSSGASLTQRLAYKQWAVPIVNAGHYFGVKNPVRRTSIIAARRLGRRLGVSLTLASEAFQETGSFQIRAAHNIVSSVSQSLFITASSGSFGRALAYACSRCKKSCIVVAPKTCPAERVEAIREYHGKVELVDLRVRTLSERVSELASKYPNAYVVDPSEDPFAIKGIASLGKELGSLKWRFDMIVAPMGGGALASGIILGLKDAHARTPVIGAKPLLANEAVQSLKVGDIVSNKNGPERITNEARAMRLGQSAWSILSRSLAGIVEITEEQIAEAMRLLFDLANLKADPTGALSVASLLAKPELFRGRSVCCVISGGNINQSLYRAVLQREG